MPFVNGKFYKPDQAITLGLCPECGRDLSQSNYTVETMLHWPHGLDPVTVSPEGIERAKMLEEFFASRR